MSIFPFVTGEQSIRKQEELPIFKEAAYDYAKNCLQLENGKTFLIEKNEAIKVWIYKALKTKRFAYQAYTHRFGNEIDNVVGLVENRSIIESEIKRYILDALMVNPYIQELSDFTFKHSLNGVSIQFVVDTIYDRFTYESEVYNA